MGLEKLNYYKKQKGFTNQQLSDLTGITISTIDKITSGNNTNPKLKTIEALCSVLGCTLNDIIETNTKKASSPAESDKNDANKQKLMNNYELLNDDGQQDLVEYSDMLAGNPRKLKEDNQAIQGLKNA